MKERLKIREEGAFNKEAILDKGGFPDGEKTTIPKGSKVMSMKKVNGAYTKVKHGDKVLWVKTSDLISEKKGT